MLTPYQRSKKLPLTKLGEVYLHLTNRCGGGCRHCYASATPRNDEVELNTSQWLGILNRLKGDLQNIWQNSPRLQNLRDNSCSRDDYCRTCRFAPACGGDCMMYGYYQSEGETGKAGLGIHNPYCATLRGVFDYLMELEEVTQGGLFPPKHQVRS